MAIMLKAVVRAYYVPDGAGSMSVPCAETLMIQAAGAPVPLTAYQMIPTPASLAALDTALGTAATALGVSIGAQLIANGNDATMFGWLTGGP